MLVICPCDNYGFSDPVGFGQQSISLHISEGYTDKIKPGNCWAFSGI
jgi:hypothetical protein